MLLRLRPCAQREHYDTWGLRYAPLLASFADNSPKPNRAKVSQAMIDLAELAAKSEDELVEMLRADPTILTQFQAGYQHDHQVRQLRYYRVVNPMAAPPHPPMARETALVGGTRSRKTDTSLAELAIRLTGHIPVSLLPTYPRAKLAKLPIRARVVCNSLTDVLEPVIKPKLRWDQWNGVDDTHGHWGWLPQHLLKGGTWEKAYSEKYRTLNV